MKAENREQRSKLRSTGARSRLCRAELAPLSGARIRCDTASHASPAKPQLSMSAPDPVMRAWLAKVLLSESPISIHADGLDPDRIIATAQREGILTLLHQRLLDSASAQALPPSFRDHLTTAAQTKVAQHLIREHHCRRILAQLDQARIPALLLKGSALAYWAYATPHLRECGDIDVLLRSRDDADRAVEILATLHFELRERALPGDLVCFEKTCVGADPGNAGLEIDLHWHLSSTPVFAFRFGWDELHAGAIPLPSLAPNARGIAPLPAFLHACMHRVQNMSNGQRETLKWLYDLVVLGKNFTPADWDELARLAIERGLAGTCADGIRAATDCFGEIAPAPLQVQLDAAARRETIDVKRMHRWWYVQYMNLLALPSTGKRLRWLRQRLLPDRAYARDRYGDESGWLRSIMLRFRDGISRLRE